MRAFIVFCLVAAACADKLGYNYKPVGHSDFGLSFTPGGLSGSQGSSGSYGVGGSHGVGSFGGPSYGGPVGGFNGGSHVGIGVGHSGVAGAGSAGYNGGVSYGGPSYGGHVGNGGFSSGGFSGGGFSSGGFSSGSNVGLGVGHSGGFSTGNGGFNAAASYTHQAPLEKEFYSFTANENDFLIPHIENQVVNSAKKGLRVIFIKGPEHNAVENAAVALAKHIAEQKTAIYVLHKQADLDSLTQKLHTINSNINHKPEVHFVKYRTPEDAVNAQRAIQNQYDSLGGVSNNFNGGEAPVLNFASKSPVDSHASIGSDGSSGSIASSSSVGSSGSFESSGSVGSVGSSGHSSSSNTYVSPSEPSPTYLPA